MSQATVGRPRVPRELHTRRLVLKGPDPKLAEPLRAGVRDSFEALHRWMEWAREVPTLEEQRAHLELTRAQNETGESVSYYFFLKDDDTFVGAGGFPRIDWDELCFEIGYWCHTAHEGCGYVSEAVHALTGLAFEHLGARRVEIRMSEANQKSWRVAERCGFSFERSFDDEITDPDGTPRRTRVYVRSSP
ncbi:MAG: GNAT family N-acetyltransferase [Deltaproteobacteria bacterium]|jgi:RimJ/RimL family protein N-acetyltransferase|nr:GNAT family N-acetyltransferase [Deltaproteobacteria bacterium]